MLREELEFRAAEDKEVQKHIENYQLMNQKLRDQVQRLEESLRNIDGYRKEDHLVIATTTIPGTPPSATQSYSRDSRGRSPILPRYN